MKQKIEYTIISKTPLVEKLIILESENPEFDRTSNKFKNWSNIFKECLLEGSVQETTNKHMFVKGKKLKEEYGPYKDEPYCEEIADDLEHGVWIGETSNGTSWALTINGMSQDEFSTEIAEYLAEEVSYPVRDGHLRYMDLDLIISKNFLPDEPDRFIPDLIKLGFDRDNIDKWLESPNEDEEIETWVDYDLNFEIEEWEKNNDYIKRPTEVTYDFYTLVDDDVDIDSDDYNLDDEIADRLSDDYGTDFLDFDYDIDKKSGDVYVYNIKWDLKENVGQDVAEYQKWVDYDMKRYGKISEKTNRKVRDAGLKIVKDIYGDYEVIANEPIRENKKINEAKEEDNPIKDIRTNVLEFENGGDYIDLYVDYKDGKLIAGMTTNAGIVPEYQIEYDDEKSVDENLQDLYDEIISEHPEYLETVEEKNKNS